jgi:hypothetical protein
MDWIIHPLSLIFHPELLRALCVSVVIPFQASATCHARVPTGATTTEPLGQRVGASVQWSGATS